MRFLSLGLLLFLVPVSAWGQHLACSPCSYDFGKVKIGDSVSYSIELTNNASKTLTILSKIAKGKRLLIRPLPGTDQDQSLVQHRVARYLHAEDRTIHRRRDHDYK